MAAGQWSNWEKVGTSILYQWVCLKLVTWRYFGTRKTTLALDFSKSKIIFFKMAANSGSKWPNIFVFINASLNSFLVCKITHWFRVPGKWIGNTKVPIFGHSKLYPAAILENSVGFWVNNFISQLLMQRLSCYKPARGFWIGKKLHSKNAVCLIWGRDIFAAFPHLQNLPRLNASAPIL